MSKQVQEIKKVMLADNLAKRVMSQPAEFNSISLGQTLNNYGYVFNHRHASVALKEVCDELGIDYGHGKLGGMGVTEETGKLGFDALKQPHVFAVINMANNRCFIASSKSPWLRRAVIYYCLKNIHKYSGPNTFFGNKDLIEDVEKYGVDVFKLHLIQPIPPHMSPANLLAVENEVERLAGDRLYFTKNLPKRQYSPLKPFVYYHPELVETEKRFCEIRDHYFKYKDLKEKLKGPHNKEERRRVIPIFNAATEEYNRIFNQHTTLRDKLIKEHS